MDLRPPAVPHTNVHAVRAALAKQQDSHGRAVYRDGEEKANVLIYWFAIMRRGRRLYKYFSDEKWAEAFLDGSLRFRSLAYFRDYGDAEVRGDANEGTALNRPPGVPAFTTRT